MDGKAFVKKWLGDAPWAYGFSQVALNECAADFDAEIARVAAEVNAIRDRYAGYPVENVTLKAEVATLRDALHKMPMRPLSDFRDMFTPVNCASCREKDAEITKLRTLLDDWRTEYERWTVANAKLAPELDVVRKEKNAEIAALRAQLVAALYRDDIVITAEHAHSCPALAPRSNAACTCGLAQRTALRAELDREKAKTRALLDHCWGVSLDPNHPVKVLLDLWLEQQTQALHDDLRVLKETLQKLTQSYGPQFSPGDERMAKETLARPGVVGME